MRKPASCVAPAEIAEERRERGRRLLEQMAAADDGVVRCERRDELIRLHLPLVEHCARAFTRRGEPFEDLVQVGTIGLITAVDGFDVDRDTDFVSYAAPCIRGEIKRHFRDTTRAVRVPRGVQELLSTLAATGSDLAQHLGRAPTVAEQARAAGASPAQVRAALASAGTTSLDPSHLTPGPGDLDDDLGAGQVEARESVRPLLERLDEREKQVLLMRFFGSRTQAEIAREIGVSQMHVSRILTRTLDRLRRELGPLQHAGQSAGQSAGQPPGQVRGHSAGQERGAKPGRPPGPAPGSATGSAAASATGERAVEPGLTRGSGARCSPGAASRPAR